MRDIELIVKISEDAYKATCNGCMLPPDVENVVQGIKNGTKKCVEFSEFEQQPCDDAISRAEVHDLLATWLSDYLTEETREALETIGGKVEDMLPVTPQAEPCEDCISRQAAIDAIAKIHPIDTEYDCTLYDKLDVRYVLMDLPSVTPQQETGKWIKEGEEEDVVGFRWTSRRCSKCGWTHCLVIPNNYCPNCGAKMEVEE